MIDGFFVLTYYPCSARLILIDDMRIYGRNTHTKSTHLRFPERNMRVFWRLAKAFEMHRHPNFTITVTSIADYVQLC